MKIQEGITNGWRYYNDREMMREVIKNGLESSVMNIREHGKGVRYEFGRSAEVVMRR